MREPVAGQKPKIVLAHWDGLDLVAPADIARLKEVGQVLDPKPLGSWEDPRAEALLAEANVLVGHWGCPPVDAALLERAPNLGLFAYAAGTVKMSIVDDAWASGIRVTSGANANAEPVVEFTLAGILFAGKDVFWQRELYRDPSLAEHQPEREVSYGNYDRVIGIVGASLIGRRVIEVLRAFPTLRVALYDPFVDETEATGLGVEKMELNDLCARCDLLSIHAPLLPATTAMIGAEQLALLRNGATVINTARGPIIDHDALTAELKSGRLHALLDVTDPEPLPDDHVLRTLPNVFLTPHAAGSQGNELRRMFDFAAQEVALWSKGEPALNEVTYDQLSRLA